MNTLFALALVLSATPQVLHQWTFDGADTSNWQPNSFLADVEIKEGALHARAIDWDPYLVCDGLEIPATPWQVVVIRLQASKPGKGNLFWTGDPSGPQGGLSEDRQTVFQVPEGDGFQEIVIYPFWQSAGVIRKLRLDVYNDAVFQIESIEIKDWSQGRDAIKTHAWDKDAVGEWYSTGDNAAVWAPPLALDTQDLPWASVQVDATTAGVLSLQWATKQLPGMQSTQLAVLPGSRIYNVELTGEPGWNEVVALGVAMPDPTIKLTSLVLGQVPTGPPELFITYFGMENGVNRVGSKARVTAQFTNRGGTVVPQVDGLLSTTSGLSITPVTTAAVNLDFESRGVLTWLVLADGPGAYPLSLTLSGEGVSLTDTAMVSFSEAPDVMPAAYVPEPQPVATAIDVAAYYFPGWTLPANWDPIKRTAPIRKPLLGWYDEANPEIVDWQIKWAVENGISVFLVDWYWVKGSQHLDHWLEAYKRSRYRDQLKIALMWANHNPPGSHSMEDWKEVSDYWIAEYFPLDSYYHMDGKPAVFLWDHRNIRNDLGGSEAVATAFSASQTAAIAAGYAGIHYVGLHPWGQESTMEKEGYKGVTRYHEWGSAEARAVDPMRMQFADIVETATASWQRQRESQGGLTYYPVVDTGWDSRPWHGDRARAILGRSPEHFEQLLKQAKVFAEGAASPLVILGPMNEWGEGSYIEPNTEFGFGMMNAIRNVFGLGDPTTWPVNVAPGDVGLGPYDMPEPMARDHWTFEEDGEGWNIAMGLSTPTIDKGMFTTNTLSRDPAMVVPLRNFRATAYAGLRVRMQITGTLPDTMKAQLFWSRDGETVSEGTSLRFPLATDGEMHDYELQLENISRWRGDVSLFRFDPCDVAGVTVHIDEITLIPAKDGAQ